MLRAVQNGYYFKNGGKVITYLVQGPTAEIAEYLAIESARRNVPIDQITKSNGFPIMHLPERFEMMNGRMPQPSYDLIKNFNGTAYNRDTSKQDFAMYAAVEKATIGSMAEIQAKRRLGIDVGDRVQRVAAPATQTATPAPEVNTVADDIAGAIAAGAELVDTEVVGEGVEPGTENLGQ